MALRRLLVGLVFFVAFGAEASQGCMQAEHGLAAGSAPSPQDFAAVTCAAVKPPAAMRYDANMRVMRLTRPLQAGDIVAAAPSSMMASISPGQSLYVSAHVGPVVVQRQVEALQAANPGQRLFVRAGNGKVMSVLYEGDGQ